MIKDRLPSDLRDAVGALTDLGLYGSETTVVADALRTFFSARPDLRVPVACRLYQKGRFSLSRAAEWSGLNLEELKAKLHRRDIPRRTETDSDAVEAMAKRAARLAGRPEPTAAVDDSELTAILERRAAEMESGVVKGETWEALRERLLRGRAPAPDDDQTPSGP